ncbi:low-density lipoprotein receptor-related protein 1B-like [Meleagris gallopavo]|uniref:low-density lipoprotein receptor-related protein 1B-like n=1 Tax=Meleagris gallopavo TaxID=9103 RepID=UPI0012AC40D6|nr:low-density lipoprotein receptor-related protein 1B-like [Meleagris gallopavo]
MSSALFQYYCVGQQQAALCEYGVQDSKWTIVKCNEKLFFTDYGNVAKVERCDMDGMNRTWIVDSKIEQPTALALDLINKYVYWVDIYLDNVEVVDYEGRKRHTVIKGRQIRHLCGLAVFENYLYAVNSDNFSIWQINRYNGTDTRSLTRLENAKEIRVYQKRTQTSVRSHACEVDPYGMPGGCSHICLLSSNYKTRTCRCRTGFILGSDGRSCKRPKNELFLFYGKGRPGIIRGMDLNTKVSDEYMIPIENLVNPRALDFHAETNYIYFADTTSFLIGRQKIDGTERETILKDDLDNVEGIAVDWIGNNLYWTNDGHRKTIAVARLEKAAQSRKTLLEGDMSHPRGIVVDPVNGYEDAIGLLGQKTVLLGSWPTCCPPKHPGPSQQNSSPAGHPLMDVRMPIVAPPCVQDSTFALVEPHQIPLFQDVQQIAIDWITGNFYFLDHVSDRIFVCNQNGTVCITLIELDLSNPKAIAVDPTSGFFQFQFLAGPINFTFIEELTYPFEEKHPLLVISSISVLSKVSTTGLDQYFLLYHFLPVIQQAVIEMVVSLLDQQEF